MTCCLIKQEIHLQGVLLS